MKRLTAKDHLFKIKCFAKQGLKVNKGEIELKYFEHIAVKAEKLLKEPISIRQYEAYLFQIKSLAVKALVNSKDESALLKFNEIKLNAEKIIKLKKLENAEKSYKNLFINSEKFKKYMWN